MRNVKTFESFNSFDYFSKLVESISGEISDIKDEVEEIKDKDSELTDDEKAKLLMAAIDNDGDLTNIDTKDIKESIVVNESIGEGLVHVIEVIGNIAGNSAMMEFILEKIEKLTGKKMDAGKLKANIEKIVGFLRKVTGVPAKAIEKFFEFIGDKIGLSPQGKKGLQLVGFGLVVCFFFSIGVIHFPVLGESILWWMLSLTGLIGKATELWRTGKEILHLISKKDQNEIEIGPDELEQMAGA